VTSLDETKKIFFFENQEKLRVTQKPAAHCKSNFTVLSFFYVHTLVTIISEHDKYIQ
jgi:hypothetical protein